MVDPDCRRATERVVELDHVGVEFADGIGAVLAGTDDAPYPRLSGATQRHLAAAKNAICAPHNRPISGQPGIRIMSGPSAGPPSIQLVR